MQTILFLVFPPERNPECAYAFTQSVGTFFFHRTVTLLTLLAQMRSVIKQILTVFIIKTTLLVITKSINCCDEYICICIYISIIVKKLSNSVRFPNIQCWHIFFGITFTAAVAFILTAAENCFQYMDMILIRFCDLNKFVALVVKFIFV